jgi:DNA-directed RNA polymerase subunit RPC12/RpoP
MEKKTQINFQCIQCNRLVTVHPYIGTSHRNHCPYCLWSKHVDDQKPGDRLSDCNGSMKPIGLTFKQEGWDKYGKQKQGELMIVHVCTNCKKININRIAGDDKEHTVLALLNISAIPAETFSKIQLQGIKILDNQDAHEVQKQLFGIKHA